MSNAHNGGKGGKRSLPSWMSSRDTGGGGLDEEDDSEKPQKATPQASSGSAAATPTKETKSSANKGKASAAGTSSFSKLLEGVVFVLSGFVNPERSILRSQAQEMGAEFQPDWNSNCTLLVCAFRNTPKFRQVEADCGTIVSKEWISECYSQKKLVAIETYLMHVGKPWRKGSASAEACHDGEASLPERPHKRVERSLPSKSTVSASSKGEASTRNKECFSPTEVKKWAINDLNETISWLESQDESPEPSEIKKIAAEGVLTCLQDAIESLQKKQEIGQATEQWKFIPRVVKELAKLEDSTSGKGSDTKKDIYEQALTCRRIYEKEFGSLDDDPTVTKKRPRAGEDDENIKKVDKKSKDAGYDSDETIEMTEDEIDVAYKSISSKLGK